MISIKSSGTFTGAGVLTAIAASLCCITPVIALLAGSSSIAANFSWIEPARPYLIGLSVAVLAFAWYLKLKPAKTNDMDCNCETTRKSSFLQSKTFLAIVTVFAMLMMAFPLYAKMFFPRPKPQSALVAAVDSKQQVKFTIQGMSCESCEVEVNSEIAKVNGVLAYQTSYAQRSSLVTFDKSKVDLKTIEAAISKTGYKVISYDFISTDNTGVSFYEAPLVCHATPSIGCGSNAKFLLVDLEKYNDAV
jgi:mercuric ion transport protein